MPIFRLQISVLVFWGMSLTARAQDNYILRVSGVDRDSAAIVGATAMQTRFANAAACMDYVAKLPGYFQSRGFVTASIDSFKTFPGTAHIVLFLGEQYKWAQLQTGTMDPSLLEAVGWREKMFAGKPLDFSQVQSWQEKLLTQLENTGYPFAKIFLDSLQLDGDRVSARLNTDKGPLYKIDSIRLYGNARIDNKYLQRYLDIANGSNYSKEKLLRISKKLRELNYLEEEKPADLTMLGTGSVLNLYLKQKKSSQVNILIGFLPNNNQLASKKMLITGEGNLHLRNAFGSGETIGLNFQALQVESQRLNLLYQHPYFLRSRIGLDLLFDIFRKDSSFVNVNLQGGVQYVLNASQSGKLFIQKVQTIVSEGAINRLQILQTRRLPEVADVNAVSLGVDYGFNNTDYRFNPRRGFDIRVIASAGTKKIKKNNEITGLKDPTDPGFNFDRLYDTVKLKTYQFRVKGELAKYFPFGGPRSTIKTAVQAGIFQSGHIFRNELFQVGGYKLLRGFDEESQYLSGYTILTAEYRYLVGQNSFFYVLADGGWGQDNGLGKKQNYGYFGTGLGLAFETKAGIINLAWAVGKRNDTEFSLRQSKIHFGFINYF